MILKFCQIQFRNRTPLGHVLFVNHKHHFPLIQFNCPRGVSILSIVRDHRECFRRCFSLNTIFFASLAPETTSTSSASSAVARCVTHTFTSSSFALRGKTASHPSSSLPSPPSPPQHLSDLDLLPFPSPQQPFNLLFLSFPLHHHNNRSTLSSAVYLTCSRTPSCASSHYSSLSHLKPVGFYFFYFFYFYFVIARF